MDNKGSQFVLWNDSRYQYMVITQNMPMEEAVRIAESVTVCPADAPDNGLEQLSVNIFTLIVI